MAFSITSKNNSKTYNDKDVITISSKQTGDYFLDLGFEFMLTLQYNTQAGKCILFNQFNNQKFLFKGQPVPTKLEIDKICKIMVADSDEYILIKVLDNANSHSPAVQNNQSNPVNQTKIKKEKFDEADVSAIYGNDVNAAAKLKVEQIQNSIELERVAIIKQVGAKINDLKRKISMNSKIGIILHIASFLASIYIV